MIDPDTYAASHLWRAPTGNCRHALSVTRLVANPHRHITLCGLDAGSVERPEWGSFSGGRTEDATCRRCQRSLARRGG